MSRPSRLVDIGCCILLIVLVVAFYHNIAVSDKLAAGRDTIEQGYPEAVFARAALRSGYAPIWNPYMMSGAPTYSAAPFRPRDIFLPHISARIITNWVFVFYTCLGCALMFLMMRKWRISAAGAMVAALAFGLSGFFVPKMLAGHGAAFASGAWIPLVFLALDAAIENRKPLYAALAGGVFGLQILGEHPQYAYYTMLAMIGYTAYRAYPAVMKPLRIRPTAGYIGLLGTVAVFALAVSAVYTLPFAQFTASSSRGGGTGYDYSSSLSLPFANLITVYAPNLWGSPVSSNSVYGALYWDANLYAGIVPLMLAVFAVMYSRSRRARYFKWLALISILVALGGSTPLYRLLYHVPGFGLVRVPAKALFLYSFAVSALAGYGLDAITELEQTAKRKMKIILLAAVCLSVAAFVGFLAARPAVIAAGERLITTTRGGSVDLLRNLPGLYALQLKGLGIAFVFTTLCGFLIWVFARKPQGRLAPATLVGLAFIDLAIFGSPLVRTVDPAKVYGFNSTEIAFLKRQPGPFRILPLGHSVFMYAQGMLTGIESVNGYYPVCLRRYAKYVGAINRKPMKVDVSVDIGSYRSPLLNLLNVRYVLSEKPVRDPSLRLVHKGNSYIYERATLPRVFIVHSAEIAADEDSALRRIMDSGFDPTKRIVLETNAPQPTASFSGMSESVEVTSYRPNRLDLSVRAAAPAYLFLSEVYYPGWQAELDGKPVEVVRANYLFRSVYVPAGKHEITFIYDPALRRIGAKLTVASMLLLPVLALYPVIRRRLT